MSVILNGCTTGILKKLLKKKLDGYCIIMQRTVLNKLWKQHPTKQQQSCHLPPFSQTIQIRWTKHTGHLSEKYGQTHKLRSFMDTNTWTFQRWPTSKDIHQHSADTGCSLGDLPGAMDSRNGWRVKGKGIRATSTTCWW